ncbi:hypothetical protein CcNV_028 [Crangon crangon nudivirus]|uniref:Uncharacterized protein n=1 Tax=Crangon crangon nudivirus TaxID=2880838 RepID=A0AAE9BZ04_9VIRU|nr:hypothetical protein QKT25_gp028 [Crangon crangon nudivirus]UBZ25512.1 hypothetical protein CcNV_028 [Crangon crangon nudivirus]
MANLDSEIKVDETNPNSETEMAPLSSIEETIALYLVPLAEHPKSVGRTTLKRNLAKVVKLLALNLDNDNSSSEEEEEEEVEEEEEYTTDYEETDDDDTILYEETDSDDNVFQDCNESPITQKRKSDEPSSTDDVKKIKLYPNCSENEC